MQYSPYSATMNPYQTIYNNGGAAAYQPTWGYSDLFAHTLGINSTLPLGYTRQQYNEERALAAESMWKSPLLGLGTFAAGTAVSYAVWGSPFQDLANKVGKGAAFQAGFNNMPNASTIFQARRSMWEAQGALRAATAEATAGLSSAADIRAALNTAELRGLRANAASAASAWQAQVQGSALRNTFWGRVGGLSSGYNALKESVTSVTARLFKSAGSGIGSVFETSANTFGGLIERQLNAATGNVVSPWLQKTGTSLFEASESGWMATSLRRAGRISSLETQATKLFELAEKAKTVEEAGKLITRAETLSGRAAALRGGVFGGIKRYAATGIRNASAILKSGKGITGLLSAGGKAALTTGIGFAGGLAAQFLNPVTMAEMYLIDQAVQYGTDIYQNYQTENEIKRNLMAKGGRILQYGFADGARGLQGGFSTSQRDQIVSRIRSMAEAGASRGDLFGLGSSSFFGGHHRYSERLKELKSILNVGTDMGFFDMSRSMDDFEKKFEQTVKTVDKLSKLLKRTKGEIMTVMANVQNTEGLYNMSAINNSVLKKDYAARLSGVDLTTAMQESAAGAQMSRQVGFSASLGASIMSDNRVLMNRAIRSGDLSREDIFRLGGEQGILMNMQQGMLAALSDESFRQELAMNYELDPVTKRYVFKGDRIKRLANASDTELRKMHDERYLFSNGVSYSYRKYARVRGGKLYDISRDMQADLAKGKISQDQMAEVMSGLIRQRHAMLNPNSAPLGREEALAQAYETMGIDYDIARVMAKNASGRYSSFKAHDDMMVAVDRYRDAYDKSGMGFGMLVSNGFDVFHSSYGAIGAGIGASAGAIVGGLLGAKIGHAGGGALIGSGAGAYVGKIATAGAAVLLHNFAPQSSLATDIRNDLKKSFIAQGLNPNFVDSYLIGPSDEEKVANIKAGEAAKRLQYLVRMGGGLDTTAANTGSNYWKTLANSFDTIAKAENSSKAKSYAEVFRAANNAAASDTENTLEGILNVTAGMTSAQLKEHGISKSDAMLLTEISRSLKSGDKIDLTQISGSQLNRVGEMLGVAFSVAGKDKLYENKQKLMNILQIDSKGTTELDYRSRLFNSKSNLKFMTDASKNVGFTSTFVDQMERGGLWNLTAYGIYNIGQAVEKGIYRKYFQNITNQAELNYINESAEDYVKTLENRAASRSGFFNKFFGSISDNFEYYVTGDKNRLNRLRSMSESLNTEQIEMLDLAITDPRRGQNYIKKHLNEYGQFFKDEDVEWQYIQKIAREGALTSEEKSTLGRMHNLIKSYMGFGSLSKVASKVLAQNSKEMKANAKIAFNLFSSTDNREASNTINKGALDFVKGLLDQETGFTKDQQRIFLGGIEKDVFLNELKGKKDDYILQQVYTRTANVLANMSNKAIENTEAEKTMNADGSGANVTVLTDQAMANFKEGSLIIKEVAGRLGFY